MRRLIWVWAPLAVACGTNEADLCSGRKAGDLVITEVLNNPAGGDTGNEFIEFTNKTAQDIKLAGVNVYIQKADGGTGFKQHVIRTGTIPAGGYFTLGDVRSGPLPDWLNYSYGDSLGAIPNESLVVGLKCRDTLIDEVTLLAPSETSHAWQLNGALPPSASDNDTATNWCSAPASFGTAGSFGSPGQANPECGAVVVSGTCLDNGSSRPVVFPSPGQLIISEVMADPKAVTDGNGEWLELSASADVDLNGLILQSGKSKNTLASAQCLRVPKDSYAVLAHSTDPLVNGGLPSVLATFSVSLTNAGGTLTLGLADAGVDLATYPAAIAGVAAQLDPSRSADTAANDDPAAFCRATVRYGSADAGDFGTPGAANTACPPVIDMNSCVDPDTQTTRAIVKPAVGDLVITEFMANPKAVGDDNGEWFEVLVKAAVDLNGLSLGTEGTSMSTVTSTTCLRKNAGDYALFARSLDTSVNGGLPDVAGKFTYDLANSGTKKIVVKSGTTVVDEISYTTSVDGASTQLNPLSLDAVANDSATNFCTTPAGTVYGTPVTLADGGTQTSDRGTPGVANVACP